MRWDIVNHLIKKNGYKSYLEIGYYKGWSFDRVECYERTAVDPNPCKTPDQEKYIYGSANYAGDLSVICKMTSDEYFKAGANMYDIIFIDGLHESTQVDRDIQNALKHLNKGGTIVMHDCNPSTEEMTLGGTANGEWTGDVYKSFLNFLENEFVVIDGNDAGLRSPAKYDAYVVDTDYGVGIIKPLKFMPPIDDSGYLVPNANIRLNATEDWKVFDENRKGLLNLISPEEFLKKEAINQEENV